jgi:xanthine dehydrogenase accessory factor
MPSAAPRRAAILVVTDLSDGSRRVVREGDAVTALGEAVGKAFRSGSPATVEAGGGRAFFLNVHLPQPRLVVIGAVHISQALAPMAAIAGFPVEIIDPRTAFATPERFPDVALSAEWPEDRAQAAAAR